MQVMEAQPLPDRKGWLVLQMKEPSESSVVHDGWTPGTDCSFGGTAYVHGPGSHTTLPHPSSSFHSRPASRALTLLGQELLFCRNLSGSLESPESLYMESLPRARSPQRNGVAVKVEENINNRSTHILISLNYSGKHMAGNRHASGGSFPVSPLGGPAVWICKNTTCFNDLGMSVVF